MVLWVPRPTGGFAKHPPYKGSRDHRGEGLRTSADILLGATPHSEGGVTGARIIGLVTDAEADRKDLSYSEPGAAARWDHTYQTRGITGVSWFQSRPTVSLELIKATAISRDATIIDVGAGASVLVDHLLGLGFKDVSVLDVSHFALDDAKQRLGSDAPVTWLRQDLLSFTPTRRYNLWHDRAVFHFLVGQAARAQYVEVLKSTLAPGGVAIIGTFASDGPEKCSGLPVVRYSEQTLAAALGDGFHPVESRRELHRTPSGATQPFSWVAVKAS